MNQYVGVLLLMSTFSEADSLTWSLLLATDLIGLQVSSLLSCLFVCVWIFFLSFSESWEFVGSRKWDVWIGFETHLSFTLDYSILQIVHEALLSLFHFWVFFDLLSIFCISRFSVTWVLILFIIMSTSSSCVPFSIASLIRILILAVTTVLVVV